MIEVTKHAIARYRERLFDFSSSEGKIKKHLMKVARQGKPVNSSPNIGGRCAEVRYQGIAVVVVYHADSVVVITTCLGDRRYRQWVKAQEPYPRVRGRMLLKAGLLNSSYLLTR